MFSPYVFLRIAKWRSDFFYVNASLTHGFIFVHGNSLAIHERVFVEVGEGFLCGCLYFWLHIVSHVKNKILDFSFSIANFSCKILVYMERSLLIFSNITFKNGRLVAYWMFHFPDSIICLALAIKSSSTLPVWVDISLVILNDVQLQSTHSLPTAIPPALRGYPSSSLIYNL